MLIDKIHGINKDLSNLYEVVNIIKKDILSSYKNDIKIEDKTLRRANVEQPALLAYYDELRVNFQSLSDYMEIRISEQRARLLRNIQENSSNSYGERMAEKLIDDDPAFVELKLKKLEVDEVLELTKAIVKQFDHRGYSLSNITKLVVAQAQDDSLIMTND